jgi:hypothetical protein
LIRKRLDLQLRWKRLNHARKKPTNTLDDITPGWGALKKRTRAQDDFASAVSRRACLDTIFLQIKVAGNCTINFPAFHAHACNLSSLGLSNTCAQSGYCLSVVFVDNVWFFFVCESVPSKE